MLTKLLTKSITTSLDESHDSAVLTAAPQSAGKENTTVSLSSIVIVALVALFGIGLTLTGLMPVVFVALALLLPVAAPLALVVLSVAARSADANT